MTNFYRWIEVEFNFSLKLKLIKLIKLIKF